MFVRQFALAWFNPTYLMLMLSNKSHSLRQKFSSGRETHSPLTRLNGSFGYPSFFPFLFFTNIITGAFKLKSENSQKKQTSVKKNNEKTTFLKGVQKSETGNFLKEIKRWYSVFTEYTLLALISVECQRVRRGDRERRGRRKKVEFKCLSAEEKLC